MTDDQKIVTLETRAKKIADFADNLRVQSDRLRVHLFGPTGSPKENIPLGPNPGVVGLLHDSFDRAEWSLVSLGKLLLDLTVHVSDPADSPTATIDGESKQQDERPVTWVPPAAAIAAPERPDVPNETPTPRPTSAAAALTGAAG